MKKKNKSDVYKDSPEKIIEGLKKFISGDNEYTKHFPENYSELLKYKFSYKWNNKDNVYSTLAFNIGCEKLNVIIEDVYNKESCITKTQFSQCPEISIFNMEYFHKYPSFNVGNNIYQITKHDFDYNEVTDEIDFTIEVIPADVEREEYSPLHEFLQGP